MNLLLPNTEIREVCAQRRIKLRELRHNFAHEVKLLRLTIRERAKHRAVHDREDGSGCADAKRQCEDGHGSEARISCQHTNAKSEVLPEREQVTPPAFCEKQTPRTVPRIR